MRIKQREFHLRKKEKSKRQKRLQVQFLERTHGYFTADTALLKASK
jgi:hypothetical protein